MIQTPSYGTQEKKICSMSAMPIVSEGGVGGVSSFCILQCTLPLSKALLYIALVACSDGSNQFIHMK